MDLSGNKVKQKLIDCPICNGKIATDAKTCPHCGHPLKSATDILKKASVNVKAVATNPTVSTAVKTTGRKLFKMLKILIWIVISGTLLSIGNSVSVNDRVGFSVADAFIPLIGIRMPGNDPEGAAVWCLLYPILFTKPCVILSKFLVGVTFSRTLYFLCSIFYLPSTVSSILSLHSNIKDTSDGLSLIIGIAISVLWTLHFIHCANPKKSKVILIVFNLLFAIPAAIFIMIK